MTEIASVLIDARAARYFGSIDKKKIGSGFAGLGEKRKTMIKRYTDHSANERTYLAWIRTSIAIMAFGFLIEKFDLFISYIGKAAGDEEHFHSSLSAELIGLGLFLVGVLIVITATVRFFSYKKSIESDESIPYSVRKTNILLSSLIILLAIFLFVYMAHQFID